MIRKLGRLIIYNWKLGRRIEVAVANDVGSMDAMTTKICSFFSTAEIGSMSISHEL